MTELVRIDSVGRERVPIRAARPVESHPFESPRSASEKPAFDEAPEFERRAANRMPIRSRAPVSAPFLAQAVGQESSQGSGVAEARHAAGAYRSASDLRVQFMRAIVPVDMRV